ncbi:hypothetical protein ABK040_013616 [Willaertia magna]
MSSFFKAANFVEDEEEHSEEEEVSEEEVGSEEEESEEEESEEEEDGGSKKKGFFDKSRLLESDEEEEEEEEKQQEKPQETEQELRRKKWLKEGSDEEESEEESDEGNWSGSEDTDEEKEEKVVAKSHREKYLDDLREVTEKMEDYVIENNWKGVFDDYPNLLKVIDKIQKLEEYKGKKKVPNHYIRFIAYLDTELDKIKDKKNELKGNASKQLVPFLNKFKKNNKAYEDLIKECKQTPEMYPDSDDEVQTQEPEVKRTPEQKEEEDKASKIEKLKNMQGQNTVEDLISEYKLKKGISAKEQILNFKQRLSQTEDHKLRLQLIFAIIITQFDLPKVNNNYLSLDAWKDACIGLIRLVSLIEESNAANIIFENIDSTLGEALPSSEIKDETAVIRLPGNVATVLERLDDEFIASLQYIDPHTQDYVKRLKDEILLLEASERVYKFYATRNNKKNLARVAVRLFDHLYYRKQEDHEKLLNAQRTNAKKILEEARDAWIEEEKTIISGIEGITVNENLTFESPNVIDSNLTKLLSNLSSIVYENGTDVAKIKTILMHIYHHAVYGRFFEARNFLVTSKLQDTIHHFEVPIQILFNRAIAQIGVCAFRNGLIQDSHSALLELYGSAKQKELLAQGLTSRHQQSTRKELLEKIERSRLVPYHQHINLDLIEGVHLICALILEVPNIAMQTYTNVKPKVLNKSFRRVLDFYNRQYYVGPPENTRDHINAAYRAISTGDWQKGYDILLRLDELWSLIPDDQVKEMLKKKIKVSALKAYIFKFSKHYDTMSIDLLSKMFDLPASKIHSIVNKMIINEEFYAGFDHTNSTIVVYHSEPSNLQYSALQLTERLSNLVEYNEKLYEAKMQGGGYVVMNEKQQKRTKKSSGQKSSNQQGQQQRQQQQDGTTNATQPNQQQKTYNKQKQQQKGGNRPNKKQESVKV